MRKNGRLQFILFFILVVAVFVAHSQGSTPQTSPALVPNTPIDGGLFLMMATGLFYGAKVLYRKD